MSGTSLMSAKRDNELKNLAGSIPASYVYESSGLAATVWGSPG